MGQWTMEIGFSRVSRGDKIHNVNLSIIPPPQIMDKRFEVNVPQFQRGQPLKRRCIHLKMLAVISQPLEESGALSIRVRD